MVEQLKLDPRLSQALPVPRKTIYAVDPAARAGMLEAGAPRRRPLAAQNSYRRPNCITRGWRQRGAVLAERARDGDVERRAVDVEPRGVGEVERLPAELQRVPLAVGHL